MSSESEGELQGENLNIIQIVKDQAKSITMWLWRILSLLHMLKSAKQFNIGTIKEDLKDIK